MAQKFKVGDKVQLKGGIASSLLATYGLEIGDEGIVINQSYGYYTVEIYCRAYSKPQKLSFEVRYLELVKVTSREKIEARIESIRKEIVEKSTLISELQDKIKYMDEVGSDIFDENEFKAYQTLTIIEKGNLSKIDKARAIAQLLNTK